MNSHVHSQRLAAFFEDALSPSIFSFVMDDLMVYTLEGILNVAVGLGGGGFL